ncbi:FAD/NAD(P)-binding domain-containing protein [Meredithblackwellia eburnea MCA 4105]
MSNHRESEAVDVLVIGGGMSGLSAGATAAEHGAKVLLVEKGDRTGGSAQYSAGMFFSARNIEEMVNHVPEGDVELLSKLVNDHLPAVADLKRKGVRVDPPFIPTVTMGQAFPADVKSLFIKNQEIIEKHGGEVRVLVAGQKLLVDAQGRVTGATLRHVKSGKLFDIHAKAVILASGGFQGSPELLTRFLGKGADNLFVRSNENSVGDGFRMGTEAGAGVSRGLSSWYGHLMPSPLRVSQIPRHKFPWVSQYESANAILVNRMGLRFCNEARMDDENNQDVLRQPGSRAWILLDSRIHKKYCVAPPFPNAGDFDRVQLAKEFGGRVAKTDTVEDLVRTVEEWGVNGFNLRQTLSDYTRFATGDKAVRLDAPITNPAAALLEAPFYALEVQPSITFPYGGLKINTSGEALDPDGNPVKGLYVAGVDAGGFSNNSYAGGLVIAYCTGKWSGKSAAAMASSLSSKL